MDNYSLSQDVLSSWERLSHTLLVGTLAYGGLILWLRVSGKRTLSKWNSFDFVVTIAFGSILASALLTTDVSLIQAMVAIGLLVIFQFILTWLSVRSNIVQNLIKAKPTLLFFKGNFIEEWLIRERVAKGEVLAAIRLSGNSSLDNIDPVILETNGSFSVIKKLDTATASALRDVQGFKERAMLAPNDGTQNLDQNGDHSL